MENPLSRQSKLEELSRRNIMNFPEFNRVVYFKPRYDEVEAISTSSKVFTVFHFDDRSTWMMTYDSDDEGISIKLVPKTLDPERFDLEIHLALVNSAGSALTRWELWRLSGSKLKLAEPVNGGFIMDLATIDENIDDFCDENGCLTLKMLIFTKTPDTKVKEKKTLKDRSTTKDLLDDLKKAYETGDNSDVIVRSADGVELKLHKFILSVRSSTFSKMFNIDMREKETGFVQIKDFEAVVLKEMFKFIYFNRVENLDTVDVELFKAAKRYDIKNLAELCKESIIDNINKRGLVELLELAHVYNEEELFGYVAKIIYSQYDQIVKSEDWKKLKVEIRIRAYELILKMHLANDTDTLEMAEIEPPEEEDDDLVP